MTDETRRERDALQLIADIANGYAAGGMERIHDVAYDALGAAAVDRPAAQEPTHRTNDVLRGVEGVTSVTLREQSGGTGRLVGEVVHGPSATTFAVVRGSKWAVRPLDGSECYVAGSLRRALKRAIRARNA